MPEGVMSAASSLFGELRLIFALGVLAVLAYWTVERVLGEGDDPTLRYSSSSDTGYASMLISGTNAVLVLVGGAVVLLGPEIAAGNTGIVVVLVGLTLAHWYFEKEERE